VGVEVAVVVVVVAVVEEVIGTGDGRAKSEEGNDCIDGAEKKMALMMAGFGGW